MQWPSPEGVAGDGEPEPSTRLFEDGRFPTPDGRAAFHPTSMQPPAEELTDEFPLALVTGRVKDQWHTMTRTGKVRKLNRRDPAPFLEVHPEDASAIGLSDRAPVRVTGRRGTFEVPAHVTDAIRPGTVFAPFHWGALFGPGGVANSVTSDAIDARSKQPELKFAAVRLEPVV